MFKPLALLLLGYALWAVTHGKVVVRRGAGTQTVIRADQPVYFWFSCAVYVVLALAMATIL